MCYACFSLFASNAVERRMSRSSTASRARTEAFAKARKVEKKKKSEYQCVSICLLSARSKINKKKHNELEAQIATKYNTIIELVTPPFIIYTSRSKQTSRSATVRLF